MTFLNNKRKKYLIIVFSVFGVLMLLISLQIYQFKNVLYSERQFTQSSKIYDRNGTLLYEILNPNEGKKTNYKYEQIPEKVTKAILAAEDIDYFNHGAIDLRAIFRALYLNIRAKQIVSGGSTISQQLARNLIGTQHKRTYINKIRETISAFYLHHKFSKEEILQMYLAKVYFGNLSYGIQAASLDYFDKNVTDLDLAQIALLAGLPKSPNAFNPFYNFDRAKKRQEQILHLMKKNNFITQEELDLALSEKLFFRKNIHPIKAPHFVYFIINQLEQDLGYNKVHYGGLKIHTTLDYNTQLKAEKFAQIHIDRLKDNNVSSSALLSLDLENNEVRAWLGSKDYFDKEIQGAVDMITSYRQPGSALKPFTYFASFLKDYTPATTIADIPTQFQSTGGPYTPKNYDLKFHGLVRLRTALASSYNVPAVKVLEYIGINHFIDILEKFGIKNLNEDPSHYGLALTLGGAEVRPFDLANAYSTLANYGNYRDVKFIKKITDKDEKEISYGLEKKSKNLFGEKAAQAAYLVVDILSDKNARIPGFGSGNFLELSKSAAAKTGTTRNFRDNWTVGFTPDLLTLVWAGNADGSPMSNVSGVSGAAPLWNTFMEEMLKNEKEKKFEIPDRIKEIEICEISGKLPTELCTQTIFEKFIEGTQPVIRDNMLQKFRVKKTGNESCVCFDSECKGEDKVFKVYPSALQRWALANNIEMIPPSCPDQYSENNLNKEIIVEIANPLEDDSYLFDHTLPLESQKIPLRVNTSSQVKKIIWIINDKEFYEIEKFPFTYLLPIQKGVHDIQAKAMLMNNEEVLSKKVKFEVK